MSQVQVNCVGFGRWGPNLVRVFATHPGSHVRTVCDLNRDRLELVGDHIPGVERTSSDPLETVQDPGADAVVIATPVDTHYELTKAALEAGKHVLVEKPICANAAQAEELVALAESKQLVLAVGHVFVFNRGIRFVRDLIQEGEVGTVRYAFATRTNLGPVRYDVNAFWDLAAHDLSIFRFWFGADPVEVTAHGHRFLGNETEDVVVAGFTYPAERVAYVHASWLNPRKVREITVVGEKRMVVWNDMDLIEPVRIYDASVDESAPPAGYSDTFAGFRAKVRKGDVRIPQVPGEEPLVAEASHFLECVRGDAEPLNSGRDGLRVLHALEATSRSLSEGSVSVEIPAR